MLAFLFYCLRTCASFFVQEILYFFPSFPSFFIVFCFAGYSVNYVWYQISLLLLLMISKDFVPSLLRKFHLAYCSRDYILSQAFFKIVYRWLLHDYLCFCWFTVWSPSRWYIYIIFNHLRRERLIIF